MDLDTNLRGENRKSGIDRLVRWAGNSPARFRALVERMTGADQSLARPAAWVVGDCAERHPELAAPHLSELLENLTRPGRHDAIPRHTFRVLLFADIPPQLEGRVLSVAMAALGGTAPVAVKALAISLLKQLSLRHPAVLTEVRALVDEILPGASPGIRARVRREFGSNR